MSSRDFYVYNGIFLYEYVEVSIFFLYDAVPPCDTQLPSETLFVTTIYTSILMEVVYHRGEQYRIRKN